MTEKPRPEIDQATLYRLAAEASCDPRTIKRAYQGDNVRGIAGERARKALIAAGLLPADTNDEDSK